MFVTQKYQNRTVVKLKMFIYLLFQKIYENNCSCGYKITLFLITFNKNYFLMVTYSVSKLVFGLSLLKLLFFKQRF